MSEHYNFFSKLFLRAPHYSFSGYDLHRLPGVLRQQEFLNAVRLASPAFYEVLRKKEFAYDKLGDKQKHTLRKYYNRMCFRPTPFGSFASFTLLPWGSGQQVKLAAGRLRLLPDLQLVTAAGDSGGAGDFTGPLVINPCLYRANDVFRYMRSEVNPSGKYSFNLAGIAANDFNEALLARLNAGKSVDQLLDWIMSNGQCDLEEAREYLRFLITDQVVLNQRSGTVIGESRMDQPAWGKDWGAYWKKNALLNADIDLNSVFTELENMVGDHAPERQFFYAALERKPQTAGPPETDQQKLAEALRVMQLLNNGAGNADLADFTIEFSRRFDQQKIPLLAALDPDTGIAYSNLQAPEPAHKHLDDLVFPEQQADKRNNWSPVHQLLFRRWIGDRQRDPWSPIIFEQADLTELEDHQETSRILPQTQTVMYRNTGEHLLIENAGGVSATSLIGRFSVFSDEVHHFCREIAALEAGANPDVIFADIVQLGDLHVDNINRRQPIYEYEIPVNVFSGQPKAFQIPPNDLLLSVSNGTLILESVSLGRRVVPRLSSAYNFRHNTLPVFRLLCDLQYQELNAGFALDTEQFFPGLPFYPRVCTRDVVLSLAKWRFSEEELRGLKKDWELQDASEAMRIFRATHQLPRYVSLGETDQQLVFDLAVKAEIVFFLDCIENMKTVMLQEYFYPDRSVMTGNKPLAGQIIAFLHHQKLSYKAIRRNEIILPPAVRRNFMAGSEWLYLKIFCSPRVADEILGMVIQPFIADYSQVIEKWFFIRYTEQGNHLRLRFNAEENDLALILPELNRRFAAAGYDQQIKDYQTDTYRREIERYGADLIPEIENLFQAGSGLVTTYLQHSAMGWLRIDNLCFALWTAKKMIELFLPVDRDVQRFLKEVRDRFMEEFKADKSFRILLDERYRGLKTEMDVLFEECPLPDEMRVLISQTSKIARLVANSTEAEQWALLADVVHMQLNRTFNVQQRQQELLVYYFLEKHVASALARKKVRE